MHYPKIWTFTFTTHCNEERKRRYIACFKYWYDTASIAPYPLFCLSEIFFSEWTRRRMIMISRIIIIMIIVFILFAILARRMRLHTLTLSGNGVYKSWWWRENREEEREKISGDVSFDASELNNGKTLDHLGTPIVLQKHMLFCSNSHHSFNTKGWL